MLLVISKNRKSIGRFLSFYLSKIIIAIVTVVMLVITLLAVYDVKIFSKTPKEYFANSLQFLEFNQTNYRTINVAGNLQIKEEEVVELINTIIKENKSTPEKISDSNLIKKISTSLKAQLPWLNRVTIIRNLSDKSLNIKITEYQPFAVFKKNQQEIITDKTGHNIVPYDSGVFPNLIILSGDDADENIASLFKVLEVDPLLKEKVYSANWVGNRRWDIVLKDGLVIKLPDNNLSDAWQRFIKIYSLKGSNLGTKVIDLRINSKIYLELAD